MGWIPEARKPESSSWPLYLSSTVSILLGSMVQLATREVPSTVSAEAPRWFDYVFAIMSPIGAALILIALCCVKDLASSLRLEQIGCIITAFMGFAYFAAVLLYVAGPPKAGATWLFGGVSVYMLWRAYEIQKTFRQARKTGEKK